MSDLAKDATFTNYVVSTMVNKLSKTQMAEEAATKSQKEGKQKRMRKSQKSGDEVELLDKSKRLVCRGV